MAAFAYLYTTHYGDDMRLNRRQLRNMILKEMRAGDMMGGRANSVRFDLDYNRVMAVINRVGGLIKGMRQFYYQSYRGSDHYSGEYGHKLPSGDYGGEISRRKFQKQAQEASVGIVKLADDLEEALTVLQTSLAETSGSQADTERLFKLLQYVPRVCDTYKKASLQPHHQICDNLSDQAINLIGLMKNTFF